MALSQAAVFAKIEPFWSWHTPIAWTGYILFIDGLIWHRRGESPLRNDRAEMVFLTIVRKTISARSLRSGDSPRRCQIKPSMNRM